ncbi:MAG: peptidoglycan DD-metalloendopeptidase family protein [Desulfosalsimonas sp.]
MYYTKAQYRAYICSLRRRRRWRDRRIRPFSLLLLAMLFAVSGVYVHLQESSASLTGSSGLSRAEAESTDSGEGGQGFDESDKSLDESEVSAASMDAAPANPAARSAWDQEIDSMLEEETFTVSSGDTLINIMIRAGLAGPEAYKVVQSLQKVFDPASLKSGQELSLGFIDSEQTGRIFQRLRLKTDFDREYQVMRDVDQGYSSREVRRKIRTRPARAEAEINSSLYNAARGVGLPMEALMQVMRAYSYDVDFQRDIRPGDSMEILYEEKIDEDGQKVATGKVLFAALHTNGRSLRIYRHKTEGGGSGFYNAMGESVRKALMVTPVESGRVSSGYGMRKHPISGYNKMHEGLDFAAPRGTPVMAAGDGVVEYAGRRGSYGHYVRIRHPNNYKTVYAHLNGYAENIKSGTRVEQGQTIGYVGSTGRSTGPHLHYEVMHAGNSINPSKMKTKPGKSLEGKDLERFMTAKAELEELYASLGDGTRLAAVSTDSEKAVKPSLK